MPNKVLKLDEITECQYSVRTQRKSDTHKSPIIQEAEGGVQGSKGYRAKLCLKQIHYNLGYKFITKTRFEGYTCTYINMS